MLVFPNVFWGLSIIPIFLAILNFFVLVKPKLHQLQFDDWDETFPNTLNLEQLILQFVYLFESVSYKLAQTDLQIDPLPFFQKELRTLL